MQVRPEVTPNPNAMKFSVGTDVGGPGTYVSGDETEERYLSDVLSIEGVSSVFFTADFVTITKTPGASWDDITPKATEILERQFVEPS